MTTLSPTAGVHFDEATTPTTPWRRLAATALALAFLGDVALMLVIRKVIPPMLLVGLVTVVVAAGLLRGRGRLAPALAVVFSLAGLLGSGPFSAPAFGHPSTPFDITHATLTLGGRLLAAVAAVAILRGATDGARVTGRTALAVLAAVAVATGGVSLATPSDAAEPGDARVAAVHERWTSERIEVERGQALLVENADPVRHTFAIGGTDIEVELPGWKDRRIALDLAPGTYAVWCTVKGHEEMGATLVVR